MQGFQDRLAQQLDYLLQGINESIDNYIQHMETIVRKMGANAPDDITQKRRFIDGLRDEDAQNYVSLRRPADLAAAKQEARNWEEVKLKQQRRRELLYGPSGAPSSANTTRIPEQPINHNSPPPQVVVNANPTSYILQNPYVTAPAYMLQTGTPSPPPVSEIKVREIVTNTLGKFKDEILNAVRPQVQGAYAVATQGTTQVNAQPPPRSNIWCGKCHGYGHLATECPTTSRVVPDQPRTLFCIYCLKSNHTEEECFVKKAHERRRAQNLQTNYNFMDRNNMTYAIGPPPQPFMQRWIP